MTYYEELGVAPNAAAPEIRQAYRVLARLVHPDGQADEQVRVMAERQMKRLNDILATLLDAQRRREYDDSLLVPAGAPAPQAPAPYRTPVARFRPRPQPARRRIREWAQAMLLNWFWIVPAVVVLGVGCWYVAEGNSPSAAESHRQVTSPDGPNPGSQPAADAPGQNIRRTPREVSHPRVEMPAPTVAPATERGRSIPAPTAEPRPAAEAEPSRPEPAGGPATAPSAPPMSTAPESAGALASAPNAPPSSAAPSAPATTAPPSFAGEWLYVPGSGDQPAPGIYPATYVEFLLTEAHGELSGNYRALYRIPDRAVSPEVLFRAQGKSQDGQFAKLGWTSADGARGEVEVRLHGPNAMSITWWTTEFGRHPSLASGSANLLRQQTP